MLGTLPGCCCYSGAQFLAVATLTVYAGAILVTFLFVLMLAQPQGLTTHDRLSWEAFIAAAVGALMIGVLSWSIEGMLGGEALPTQHAATAADRREAVLAPQHMAQFGRQMFSTHLLAMELGGVLLLVALVGAVAIIAQGHGQDDGGKSGETPGDRPISEQGAV